MKSIILIVVIVTLVILALTTYLILDIHEASENEVLGRFRAHQTMTVRQLAREIEQYLRARSQGAQVLSTFASLQHRDMKKMAADIQEYFQYVKKDYVKAMSVYDENGTIIYSTPITSGSTTEKAIGRNYAERDFIQWATRKENKGKQFVSSLIRATQNEIERPPYFRFVIVTPVYQEARDPRYPKPTHKFVGVLTYTVDLEEVIAAFLPLVSTNLTKEQVWILDTSGAVLFQSVHPEMVLKSIRTRDETCMQCHVSFDHVEKVLVEKQGTIEYALRDHPKKAAAFAPLTFENVTWILVVNASLDEVSGFLNRQLAEIFLLIGVIAVALVGASTLIYRSNRLKIRAEEEARQWKEKHALEDRIRESEERYRTIVETAHDIVWTLETQGNFTLINTRGEELTGHKVSDLIGKSFVPLIHPEDLPKVQEVFLQTLQGKPQQYDVRVYDSRSEIMTLSVNTVPLYEGDSVIGTVSFGRDITEQKRVQQALWESEKKYRGLVENAIVGVYRTNLKGDILYVNEAAWRMLEFDSAEEMISGGAVVRYKNPKDRDTLVEHLRKTGKIDSFQFEALTKTGKTKTLLLSAAITGDILTGMVLDITERRQAEEALRKKDEHHKAVIESIFKFIPEGLLVFTENFRLLKHNKAFEEIVQKNAATLGYEEQELTEKIIEQCRTKIESGDSKEIHIRGSDRLGTRPSGADQRDEVVLQFNAARIFLEEEEEEEARIVVSLLDITERRRTEEQLRLSEITYRGIIDSVTEAIYIQDENGFFLDVNLAAEQMYGYPRNYFINKTPEFLSAPGKNDLPTIAKAIREAYNGRVRRFEFWGLHKDGSIFPKEVILTPGTFFGQKAVIAVARDITERKNAEEKRKILEAQLQQAQKLESLGTLASGIAHDFNNILAIIIAHASLLERIPADPHIIKKNTEAITKAGMRGASLVKQMLTFARKTDVLVESVLLNDVVGEVAKLLAETFPKTVTVSLHLERDLPPIEADATQLHQVLLNLCVNARDAMPSGGTLTVTTRRESGGIIRTSVPKATADEYIVLSMADTGTGMDEVTKQRIFEPFFTTKGVGKGTGLGLSLVFGIMESHNGIVTVQSELDKGTIFHCYFPVPRKPIELERKKEQSAEEISGGSETVLLVEDEEMLRELAKALLEAKGYTVLTAGDGEEAFAVFQQHQNEIQLVISDLGLPKFGGDELYRKLKMLNPRLPLILASGFIEPGMKAQVLREGVKAFIPKPYNPNELLRTIRSVLDKG